ncbi:hypothetical protein DRQ00_00500 [candidate division KSB1 bacterium]|nr:MAG: hypothetical protein DRQ00_00500 [candidate division KSB1 bacterium]
MEKKSKKLRLYFQLNYAILIGLLPIFWIGNSWKTSQAAPQKEQHQLTDLELEHAASKLLTKSQAYFEKGEYWKAAQDMILIMDYYPDYSRLDEVIYTLGNCLFQMELFKASEKIYRYLILNIRNSSFVPYALYGLERIYYETKQYERAIEYFHLLRKRFPNITVDEGIYYYGGLSYFYLEDYDNAILILSAIDNKSEYWGYALYTRSLAYFKKKISIMLLRT